MQTVVDLFCGGGGSSRGFHQAGFHTSLAVDNNYFACQTFSKNFPDTLVLNENIQELHSLEILEKVDAPDVVLASPPCESFSRANMKRKKVPQDRLYDENSTGRLMLDAIRLIGDLEPKYFIIENVVPVTDGKLRDILGQELENVGFSDTYFNILNAEWYGLPSKRERVFISNLKFGLSSYSSTKTVEDAFHDLPPPEEPHKLKNHYNVHLPQKYEKKLPTLAWGRGLMSFRGAGGKALWNLQRLIPHENSPTVMGLSQFIHPFEDRRCTVREHARLMSFPDDHIFIGSTEAQYNQVGEAVPPLISFFLARELSTRLKEI